MSNAALSPAQQASIEHARQVRSERSAVEALKSPRELNRALRIVRAALRHQVVTLDALTGEVE